MAHKKGQGAAKNGRDSTSKRRGVKKFGGEFVLAATLSSASAAQKFIPETTLEWAETTLFSLSKTEL